MPCLDAPLAADKASFSTNLSESDIVSFILSEKYNPFLLPVLGLEDGRIVHLQ